MNVLSHSQVDLGFPRTSRQISLLASTVFTSKRSNTVEELKITGFHNCPIFDDGAGPSVNMSRRDYFNLREPRTLSSSVLQEIKASCPGLKTLVIRKCVLDSDPDWHANLPGTLENLEFHGCR